MERLTFDQAVQRAIERNPSAAMAAAQILRAEAVLAQARAAAGLAINGTVTSTTLNTGVSFNGNTVVAAQPADGHDRRHHAALRAGAVGAPYPGHGPAGDRGPQRHRDAPADRARRRRPLPDRHRAATASSRPTSVRSETAKAHYDYAHTQLEAGTRQPAQRAPRAAGAVDRRGAGRVVPHGALPGPGGARRPARRRRPRGRRGRAGVRRAGGRRPAADAARTSGRT